GARAATPSPVSRVTAGGTVKPAGSRCHSPNRRLLRGVRGSIGGSAASVGGSRLPEVTSSDPHPELCDRATGNSRGDAGEVAPAVVPLEHGENRKGAEAGRHRDGREEGQSAGHPAHTEEYGPWAWAQWRRRVSRSAQGRGSACVAKGWRPVSGLSARQSLFRERAGCVGTDQRAGSPRCNGV